MKVRADQSRDGGFAFNFGVTLSLPPTLRSGCVIVSRADAARPRDGGYSAIEV